MKVVVNGKEVEALGTSVASLMEQLSLPRNGVAVAADNQMIPRADWDTTALAEGMSLVVIKAAAGG